MLRLQRPERSIEQLGALAASGSSGLARRAQAELRERTSKALAASLASQRSDGEGGSR